MDNEERVCRTCQFWCAMPAEKKVRDTIPPWAGQCRRFPPTIASEEELMKGRPFGVWLITFDDGFCGEWRREAQNS